MYPKNRIIQTNNEKPSQNQASSDSAQVPHGTVDFCPEAAEESAGDRACVYLSRRARDEIEAMAACGGWGVSDAVKCAISEYCDAKERELGITRQQALDLSKQKRKAFARRYWSFVRGIGANRNLPLRSN